MFWLIDLENILQNTSGKYCVGDQVRLVTLKQKSLAQCLEILLAYALYMSFLLLSQSAEIIIFL